MYLQFLGHRALHVNRVLCYRNCVDVNRDNLPAIMWSMVKPFMVFFMATNILCLATIFICVWLVVIIAMFTWIIIKLLPDKNYVRQPPEHESDILCFSLKGFVWAFTWCWVETMFSFVNNVYREMMNSKHWSWELCKRDSTWIPEKWSELLNTCKKSGKKAKCLVLYGIQVSLRFNPLLWILRFSSSKNIKYFFINLEQFQAMPWVWSRLNLRPLAYSEISRFSTLHKRDALSQLSKEDLKNYHWNLPGAFGVCLQMPSNS